MRLQRRPKPDPDAAPEFLERMVLELPGRMGYGGLAEHLGGPARPHRRPRTSQPHDRAQLR